MNPTLKSHHLADLWSRLPTGGHARGRGAPGNPAVYFELLRAQYEEPPRAYHTLLHIEWGLKRIEEICATLPLVPDDLAAVEFAMWFHDAVMRFDGSGDQDERDSAEMASDIGRELGLGMSFILSVRRLIMATAHLKDPIQADEKVLVDADLSILGADEAAFDEYERRVRFEWCHVGEKAFRAGRLKVLECFDAMPNIFSTPYGRERWETKARLNLMRSMAKLRMT